MIKRLGLLASLSLVASCSGGGGLHFGGDAGAPDLATPADLSDAPDLTPAPDLAISVGGHKYVLNQIMLPMQRSDYAMDLNGDGHLDNQLGNIIGAVESQGLDAQTAVGVAIQAGSALHLVSLDATDPALMNDPNAGAGLWVAKSMAPDFSGQGKFAIDNAYPASKFTGRLDAGHFSSENPVMTMKPVHATLKLPLAGVTPIVLPINGAHIQFDAQSGNPPRLVSGQLHGSIKNSDVQGKIIPAVAMALNAQVQANPGSPNTMQLLALFDTGGCANPNGTMAKANDGKIDVCEVSTNQIIQNVLAPDVQIYDANGNYAPNPANTKKDSLSMGVAFTAVRASF